MGTTDDADTDLSMDDLTGPLLGPEVHEHAWIGGEWEDYGSLASSFMDAADALAKAWAAAPYERLALPILQGYRHAIELALKDNCQQLGKLVVLGSRMGYGERLSVPANMDKKLATTHKIGPLVELFHRMMDELPSNEGGELPAAERATLDRLHQLDGDGMTFRYATVLNKETGKYAKIRPIEEAIGLRSLVNELHQAGWMLVYGVSGWLGNHEEWLMDMWSEYQDNMRYSL